MSRLFFVIIFILQEYYYLHYFTWCFSIPASTVLWVCLFISLSDPINLWTSRPNKTPKQGGGGVHDKLMVCFENFIVSKKKPFKFTNRTIAVHGAR